jgi:hypothetical protein
MNINLSVGTEVHLAMRSPARIKENRPTLTSVKNRRELGTLFPKRTFREMSSLRVGLAGVTNTSGVFASIYRTVGSAAVPKDLV